MQNTILQRKKYLEDLNRNVTALGKIFNKEDVATKELENIENKIAEMIVDGSIKNGDIVKIIKQNNDIKCIKQIYALNI